MHAAVAAGIYPDIAAASDAMGSVRRGVYQRTWSRRGVRQAVCAYSTLHDQYADGAMMHDLRAIRNAARTGQPG